jgi:hypothetical protein
MLLNSAAETCGVVGVVETVGVLLVGKDERASVRDWRSSTPTWPYNNYDLTASHGQWELTPGHFIGEVNYALREISTQHGLPLPAHEERSITLPLKEKAIFASLRT